MELASCCPTRARKLSALEILLGLKWLVLCKKSVRGLERIDPSDIAPFGGHDEQTAFNAGNATLELTSNRPDGIRIEALKRV